MRPLTIKPRHAITELALSPDGQRLGVVQSTCGFRLLDTLTGAELACDKETVGIFESAPTSRHSLHANRVDVRLAEVASGRPFVKFQTGWARIGSINHPPAEPTTSALHRAVTVYQFGETLNGPFKAPDRRNPPVNKLEVHNCALTADHRFAVGRLSPTDSWYSVCDLATETVVVRLAPPEWVQRTEIVRHAFAADGARAVTATPRTISVFDLPLPRPLHTPPSPKVPLLAATVSTLVTQPQPEPGVPPFAVLPCGQKAIFRGEKSRVELRDLTTGEVLTVWKWRMRRVHALAVAADGLTAAAAGVGGEVVIWDLG